MSRRKACYVEKKISYKQTSQGLKTFMPAPNYPPSPPPPSLKSSGPPPHDCAGYYKYSTFDEHKKAVPTGWNAFSFLSSLILTVVSYTFISHYITPKSRIINYKILFAANENLEKKSELKSSVNCLKLHDRFIARHNKDNALINITCNKYCK